MEEQMKEEQQLKNKYWQKLEFDKLLLLLAKECSFALSREKALALTPKTSREQAATAIAETSEAAEILRLFPTYSIGPVRDIRAALKRAELGGSLNIEELVEVADICRAARQNKDFFSQLKGQHPGLQAIARNLSLFKTYETAIERTITPEGTIADGASDKLLTIRRRIDVHQSRIKERLDNFIHNPNTAKFLQDPIVTIREGRFVVPVKQEYRASVAGVVHDMSSSGATLFVEPMAVMEANNELHRLQLEEQEEIQAILRALSALVAGSVSELDANLWSLAKLDFAFAKGRLAASQQAVAVKLNDQGVIRLKKARHPLISGHVVPIDVELSAELNTMVITGPNTGGKTVTLKTIGLLSLMALSGLHIPADDGSELAFFDEVFADIGDEQSIEQSLSTFSAHMTNLVYIIEKADEQSLVLLDELGSGTDPTEGAALAMSILEHLFHRRIKTVATTHYSELKSFAYNKEGFINASVEFDVETLRPTYRLLMGIPGKSNAFEISKKLGLNPAIIDRANSFLSADEQQVADLISNLEENSLKAEKLREEAELELAKVLERERQLREKEQASEIKETEILRKAHLHAADIVKQAQDESEALYQTLKEQLKNAKDIGGDVQKTRQKIKKLRDKHRDMMPEAKFAGAAPQKVEIGQNVEVPKYRQRGTVLTLPDAKGNLQVQIGIMKVTVELKDLRLNPQADEKEKTGHNKRMQINKSRTVSSEIDLRGMMVDEATEVLDKYLDDAFLANLQQVRIIHGKGTGALRAGILKYLENHRLVAEVQTGGFHDGGTGVSIVKLK